MKKQKRPPQDSFRLPSNVTSTKEQLVEGWAYAFRHRTLGLLGRLVLQEREDGSCQVSCEVAGDSEDPMTAQRFAVLQPLTTALASNVLRLRLVAQSLRRPVHLRRVLQARTASGLKAK